MAPVGLSGEARITSFTPRRSAPWMAFRSKRKSSVAGTSMRPAPTSFKLCGMSAKVGDEVSAASTPGSMKVKAMR